MSKISGEDHLEDRVALEQGKRQLYGTQYNIDEETNLYYVRPLEDADNVDKRRAEFGLESIADYLKFCNTNITWDVEQYKKDLPAIEEKEKRIKIY